MPIKILAIDDSKTMRLAIKITFAAEDAQVVAVSKGSEAIPRAKQHGADIILIDHTLAPGEPSGLQVVQELKANPATARIPVIMLIPVRGGTTEAEALAAGADAAIGKPFDTQDLIDRVNAVLSGKTATLAAPAVAAKPGVKPPVAATPAVKPPVAATPAAKPPVAATPAAKPPVAATPAAKPPVAATPAAKPPVAAVQTPAAKPPAAAVQTPAAVQAKPAVTPAAAAKPAVTPAAATPAAAKPAVTPAARPAAAQPMMGKAPAGPIPIARPIPFTAANSPTAGMLERLRAANGGAAAGLDPAAVRALLALSQEVIEQVVWEVVPDLAELLIKERMRQQG